MELDMMDLDESDSGDEDSILENLAATRAIDEISLDGDEDWDADSPNLASI